MQKQSQNHLPVDNITEEKNNPKQNIKLYYPKTPMCRTTAE